MAIILGMPVRSIFLSVEQTQIMAFFLFQHQGPLFFNSLSPEI